MKLRRDASTFPRGSLGNAGGIVLRDTSAKGLVREASDYVPYALRAGTLRRHRYPGVAAGDVRACVPLFGTHFDGLAHARHALAPGVILAGLDYREQLRVAKAHSSAGVRVEVYGALPRFEAYAHPDLLPTTDEAWAYIELAAPSASRISRRIDLLSLAARLHPNHVHLPMDVWTGNHWRRIHSLGCTTSVRQAGATYSLFPGARLATWSAMWTGWPENEVPEIARSLSYYLDSITERQTGSIEKAYVAAAMALEVLVGYQAPSEISKTIALRLSHLLSSGPDREVIFKATKVMYGVRSKLVHAGKAPNPDDLTLLQQLLMAAIPTAAAAKLSHKALMEELDLANFGPRPVLDRLRQPGWWSMVPVSGLCRAFVAS